MKITSVKTYHLKYRLSRAVGCAPLLYSERDALLVKIGTDEGLVGWGETCPLGGVRGMIEDQIGTQLIGKNPLDHRKLWREIWGPNFGDGLAVGAVDTALHDLRGKALKLSVAEMYGGRLRDRVPVYASALNYTEGLDASKHYPEVAAELVSRGLRAMKMRLGRYGIKHDLATATAVREAVGPDVKLMADGNGAYTLPQAIRVGKELERLGLHWFEEPMPQAHYAGYETLHHKLDIALAGGEVLDSRGTTQDLLRRQLFDIIQPDVSLCGGIGECLFIAELARLWGVLCHPHCWAGAITIAATLHVLSLLPDATWGHTTETPMLELDLIENPFRDKIVTRPPQLGPDGWMDVPKGPGLGIEVDEDAVKQYEFR
jgi:D-galactarolactone cycloisomerase